MPKAAVLLEDTSGTIYEVEGSYWSTGAFWCKSPDDRSPGLYTDREIAWEDDPTRLFRAPEKPFDPDGLTLLSKYRLVRVMLLQTKKRVK